MSLLAMALATLAAPSLHAAVTYNPGDLILGFRDVGTGAAGEAASATSNSYLIDLGSYANLLAHPGLVASNLNTDLTALFGTQWYNDPNLLWSVSGKTGTSNNLAATAQNTAGPGTAPLFPLTSFTTQGRNTTISAMASLGIAYTNGSDALTGFTTGGTGTGPGIYQAVSDNNSYASYMAFGGTSGGLNSNGIAYNIFNPTIEGAGSAVGNGTGGITGTSLELFSIAGTTASSLTDVGTFSINSSGQVSFALSAAPEPGRASLLLVALGCVAFRRRRKRATN